MTNITTQANFAVSVQQIEHAETQVHTINEQIRLFDEEHQDNCTSIGSMQEAIRQLRLRNSEIRRIQRTLRAERVVHSTAAHKLRQIQEP
jgi:hypothetical protein